MWEAKHIYDICSLQYDDFIGGFVPCYDTMKNTITELLAQTVGEKNIKRILELGVGTGNLGFSLMTRFPADEYVGYESSDNLYKRAELKLSVFNSKCKIYNSDFIKSIWPNDIDAIVSTLTFHYLSNENKVNIFKKAYDHLRPGGILSIGDRVISLSQGVNSLYRKRMKKFWDSTTANWIKHHRDAHKTFDDPKEEPWTLENQLEALRNIGFSDVDCVWKDYNYCVFFGIRPQAIKRKNN